jgi:integrase/recombinase XerC
VRRDGDPLTDPAARDGAVRDYRTWLQTVAGRKPAIINAILAALADFCTRPGLGPPGARRLDLPQRAPAPSARKTPSAGCVPLSAGCPRPTG